jgi:hypothetical protein
MSRCRYNSAIPASVCPSLRSLMYDTTTLYIDNPTSLHSFGGEFGVAFFVETRDGAGLGGDDALEVRFVGVVFRPLFRKYLHHLPFNKVLVLRQRTNRSLALDTECSSSPLSTASPSSPSAAATTSMLRKERRTGTRSREVPVFRLGMGEVAMTISLMSEKILLNLHIVMARFDYVLRLAVWASTISMSPWTPRLPALQ